MDEKSPLVVPERRRVPRVKMKPGVEIHVNGRPAMLLELSPLGAHVVLMKSLRPGQAVRVTLPGESETARIRASVVWITFEMRHYRAGLEFPAADPVAVAAFCARHQVGEG